jgi:hypothetical protein
LQQCAAIAACVTSIDVEGASLLQPANANEARAARAPTETSTDERNEIDMDASRRARSLRREPGRRAPSVPETIAENRPVRA